MAVRGGGGGVLGKLTHPWFQRLALAACWYHVGIHLRLLFLRYLLFSPIGFSWYQVYNSLLGVGFGMGVGVVPSWWWFVFHLGL